MNLPKGGIAFFDSGAGGLTVLSSCLRYFPKGVFYYYGDNARAPYGNRTEDEIYRFVKQAFDIFLSLKAQAVVIACNTATAVAVEKLRNEYSFPIVGAEPYVLPTACKGGKIFILSTRATYESVRYKKLCARAREKERETEILPFSCDGLAGAIEAHFPALNFCLSEYLPRGKPTAVVLGCTHYIFLKKRIEEFYGCPCYDGNDGIARRLCSLLIKKEEPQGKNRDGQPLSRVFWEGRPLAPVCVYKSKQKAKKRRIFAQKLRFFRIFFLGSGKTKNVKIYKQMFVSIKN